MRHIKKRKSNREGIMNLTWGTFMQQAVAGKKIENVVTKKSPAAAAPKPVAEKKPSAPVEKKAVTKKTK